MKLATMPPRRTTPTVDDDLLYVQARDADAAAGKALDDLDRAWSENFRAQRADDPLVAQTARLGETAIVEDLIRGRIIKSRTADAYRLARERALKPVIQHHRDRHRAAMEKLAHDLAVLDAGPLAELRRLRAEAYAAGVPASELPRSMGTTFLLDGQPGDLFEDVLRVWRREGWI